MSCLPPVEVSDRPGKRNMLGLITSKCNHSIPIHRFSTRSSCY